MKKIVRLTESDLIRIVKRTITETDRAYGHDEIRKLYSSLADDEEVELSDDSGDLSGSVVKKIDYVKNMLRRGIDQKDWSKVSNALSYLNIKF